MPVSADLLGPEINITQPFLRYMAFSAGVITGSKAIYNMHTNAPTSLFLAAQ